MEADQLDLFGEGGHQRGTHRVAAHVRLMADGSEVFVSEHLRWSRGRAAPPAARPSRPPPSEPPDEDQLWLFPP